MDCSSLLRWSGSAGTSESMIDATGKNATTFPKTGTGAFVKNRTLLPKALADSSWL